MGKITYVNFVSKKVMNGPEKVLTKGELDELDKRVDELLAMQEDSKRDSEIFTIDCELQAIEDRISNSQLILENEETQKLLEGTRPKKRDLKLVA